MNIIEDARTRLISHRKSLKLQAIADASGLSIAWLSKFERGLLEFPATRQLNKLVEYLNSCEG